MRLINIGVEGLEVSVDEFRGKDDGVILGVVREVACNEDGVAELGYFIEFSVGLVSFERNVLDWLWYHGEAVLDYWF